MLKSLFSGVSGLQSHQIAMDVESNNIANVNTTGFKYSRANFSDLLAQTRSIATAPQGQLGGKNPVQVGLGSTVSSMTRIFSQGSIQNSDKNTDVAIQGDGFFIISPDGGNTYKYTRSGDFKFDAGGNFVDNNGFIAQGWLRDSETGKVDSTAPISNINIPPGLTTPASPSGEVVLKANLNSGALVESYSPAYSVGSTPPPVSDGAGGVTISPAPGAVDGNGRPIASGDTGVMFNEIGEAFSLQSGQGIWASFIATTVTSTNAVAATAADSAENIVFTLDDGSTETVAFTFLAGNSATQNAAIEASAINAKSSITGITATVNATDGIDLENTNANGSASHNIIIDSVSANVGLVDTDDAQTAWKYTYNPSGGTVAAGANKEFKTMAELREAMELQARAVGDTDGDGAPNENNIKIIVNEQG
ncbi:MAG: flagellar hook-basal body complex protein, partial [Campylobacterota bacterium]|nr:flagellar hook-basal body complex protein [Campylobacterota bacterium]